MSKKDCIQRGDREQVKHQPLPARRAGLMRQRKGDRETDNDD
jgi:hypothetical protein